MTTLESVSTALVAFCAMLVVVETVLLMWGE